MVTNIKIQKINFFKSLSYNPLPKQNEFHYDLNKFKGYIGGLGSGKTHAGVYEALYTAWTNPESLGFILAPTYKILKDSTMRAFFKYCPKSLIEDNSRSDQSVKLINGAEILFRNCEDEKAIDRLRNIEIGWFWIDEARGVPEYAWRVLVGRLRQKESPLTGWITTTPKGFNWIYKKFVEKPGKDFYYVASSSKLNTHLPKGYISTMETEYAGRFAQQEIEGKFVGFEGMVYPEFSRSVHIVKEIPKQFKDVIVGIDWGYTNPTAITVVGVDSDKRMWLIDEVYEKQMLIDNLRSVLIQLKEKYKYTQAYGDPSEPEFIEDLNRSGLRIKKAINDVVPGISEVSARLNIQADKKPRLFVNEKCRNTIMEFERYRYKDKKEEKPEDEKPLKVDDHLMDAIRYAAMGLKEDRDVLMEFL